MIAEIFKQQCYEQGLAKGRRETVAVQKAWEGWNGRRETAQANNQPFTEPPPTLDLACDGDFARNGD